MACGLLLLEMKLAVRMSNSHLDAFVTTLDAATSALNIYPEYIAFNCLGGEVGASTQDLISYLSLSARVF
jgi:hypothetical protein